MVDSNVDGGYQGDGHCLYLYMSTGQYIFLHSQRRSTYDFILVYIFD